MITGVEHIAIFAKDPAFLKDWYAEVFKFKVLKGDVVRGTYWLQTPDGMLFELKRASSVEEDSDENLGGLRHVALTVDNFEEAVEILKRHEVEVITKPTISATGGKTMFFRDPEGNIFQLIYRSKPLF